MAHHDQTVLVGGLFKLKATGIGNIRLTIKVDGELQGLILQNALYVPDLGFRLFSTDKCVDRDLLVASTKQGTFVTNRDGDVVAVEK